RNVTTWGDLAEIDNAHSSDKENLWAYWRDLVLHYLEVGFDGFRCDAAYQVPAELWRLLITDARGRDKNSIFIAETLGCTEADIEVLSQVGFDYVYNSSKWWNFKDEWCIKQYEMSFKYTSSLSFPETHDTERLFTEVNGDIRAVKMRYQFAAFFSKAVMIPIGFEYGFKGKLDVVTTQPQDWETPRVDLVEFIREVNRIKDSYKIFNEDSENIVLNSPNENVFIMLEIDNSRQVRVLLIINLDTHKKQDIAIPDLQDLLKIPEADEIKDISPENRLNSVPNAFSCTLNPLQVKVIYGSLAKRWWD
ncbi:alpha-amylase family protein, partial [Candidatus Omnitrophota bacterium]